MSVSKKEINDSDRLEKKAFSLVAQKIHAVKGEEIFAFSGAFTDVETLVTMKDFMTKLGSTNIYLDRCYCHGHEPFQSLHNRITSSTPVLQELIGQTRFCLSELIQKRKPLC